MLSLLLLLNEKHGVFTMLSTSKLKPVQCLFMVVSRAVPIRPQPERCYAIACRSHTWHPLLQTSVPATRKARVWLLERGREPGRLWLHTTDLAALLTPPYESKANQNHQ